MGDVERKASSHCISMRISRDSYGRGICKTQFICQPRKYDRQGIQEDTEELNAQAFGDLLIAQMDKSCFQAIQNCKTSEYKKGSDRLAWEALCAMEQPKTNQMVVMLKSHYHTCKMKRNTDPNQWITSLESIHACIIEQGNDIPELEFKEHIAANLGLDYAQEAKQWLQIGLHRI